MSKKVEKNILKTLKKKERFSSYSDEGVRPPRVAEKETKISKLKKSESPLYKEYIKKRNNTQSILRRAKNDDIDVSDIVLPNVPQVISEGSVRRITDIHDKVKKEVAKRRRLKRYKSKERLPKKLPKAALDNLKEAIKKAVTYDGIDDQKWQRHINYQKAVQASGRVANELLYYMMKKHRADLEAEEPGHSEKWYQISAENELILAAGEIFRTAEDKLNAFLWGYEMPNVPEKPTYYAALREILGEPLTPEERDRLMQTGELEFVDAELYD